MGVTIIIKDDNGNQIKNEIIMQNLTKNEKKHHTESDAKFFRKLLKQCLIIRKRNYSRIEIKNGRSVYLCQFWLVNIPQTLC